MRDYKTIRHRPDRGHLHELTFSCYQHRPLLTNEVWLEMLSRSIDEANRVEAFELFAFVYMPDHVHLLVRGLADAPDLGRYLARVKQPFSRGVKEILVASQSPLLASLTVRERPGKHCFRFWQEGPGFDRNLFTPEAVSSSIDYLHRNPVRRGLCQRAVDWPWSSARFHLAEPNGTQFPELPCIHRLRFDELGQA